MYLSRWIKAGLWVSVLLPLIASAHLLSVSPTTPFPSTVSVSATASARYTVTNISTIPLTGIEDQSASTLPAGVAISSSTCGSSTPLNPGASCTISLSLHAPSTAATLSGSLRERALPSLDSVYSTIGPISVTSSLTVTPSAGANGTISPNTPQSVNYGASLSFTATPSTGYSVNEWTDNGVVSQTGGTSYALTDVTINHTVAVSFNISPQLIAVGVNDSTPIIAQSVNGGSDWAQTTVSGTPTGVSYYTASDCAGSGTDAVCIAAGSRNGNTPLLAISSGASWTNIDLTGFTTQSSFSTASCSGSGASAICLAAGQTGDPAKPLLRQSIDGGQTWAEPTVSVLNSQGQFNSSSCTGSGVNTVCTVVGINSATNPSAPLLLVGTLVDSNLSWAVPSNIAALNGTFNTTSCTGSGATATCIAAGYDGTGAPLVVLSSDGGATWAVQTIPGFSVTNGSVSASSCTSNSGTDVVCSLVGRDFNTGIPFVVMLNGSVWSVANTSISSSSYLNTTSCSGSGANARCIAAGQEVGGSYAPLLIQSIDSGVTWTTPTFSSGELLTTYGYFSGSNCTGSGVTAICTAVGNSGLFVQSLNGLSSWTNVTVSGLASANYAASSGT